MIRFCLSIAVSMVLGLTACQTAVQQSVEANAAGLDGAAVMAHISGNTETWTQGGGYYAPDGLLSVLWNGEKSVGTWEVSDDGEVCYVVDIWGLDKQCHRYVEEGGETKLLYEGKARVAKIQSGNQLDSL